MNARRRRRAWIVAAAPAAAGATSLAVGSGDFRSSGLIAGVGLSALLATVLLAVRVPWRGNSWLRRGAGVARVGVVGVVALAALAVGVPEFLQERFGLLLSPEDMGLRSVTLVDDRFVAVGAARSGAAWVSVDATSWEPVAVPETIAGADIVDLAHVSDGVFAIAQDDADAALLAVTADVTQQWREADRFAHDVFGVAAKAADGRGQQLVVAGDIYGNDVVVFHGEPPAALTADAPEPEFDRGYEVNDVACNVDGCVAVGARIRVDAAIWHSPNGADWERIDMELTNAEFVAVASTRDGFVAVGNDTASKTGVAWSSANDRAWDRLTDQETFSTAIIDGGRHPRRRDHGLWPESEHRRDHDVESHQRPELGAKGRSHRRHQDRASGTSQPTVRSASASASTQTTHLARCGLPRRSIMDADGPGDALTLRTLGLTPGRDTPREANGINAVEVHRQTVSASPVLLWIRRRMVGRQELVEASGVARTVVGAHVSYASVRASRLLGDLVVVASTSYGAWTLTVDVRDSVRTLPLRRRRGDLVVWVDCACARSQLPQPRLR